MASIRVPQKTGDIELTIGHPYFRGSWRVVNHLIEVADQDVRHVLGHVFGAEKVEKSATTGKPSGSKTGVSEVNDDKS